MTRRSRPARLFADWRDFLRELAIIVLGVLTALFAQSIVEEISWRGKVRATTDDMRQELSNGSAPANLVQLIMNRCFEDRISAAKTAVENGDRDTVRRIASGLWQPVGTYDNLAWENAVSSEISTHIPQHDKYEFRIAYVMVPELNSVRTNMLSDIARLQSLPPDGGPLSAAERQIALEAIANLKVDNYRMLRASAFTLRHLRNLGIGINRSQLQGRIAEANLHYARCLTADADTINAMIAGKHFDPR